MGTSFTRMDESTEAQWHHIAEQHFVHQDRVGDRMIMLLRSLAEITDGFNCDQLTHRLQTATLAERDGADDEVVFAALLHDVGKAVSVDNHGPIAAEMIRVHQDFQGRHYYQYLGKDPMARESHRDELTPEQFELAARFADDWDQIAFDDTYDTLPLEHFEPLIRRLTTR